jgi:hypothetical protein
MKPATHLELSHERCCQSCRHCYTIWPTGDAFCLHGEDNVTLHPEDAMAAPHYPDLPIVSLLVPCERSKYGQSVGLERDDLYLEWWDKCEVVPHSEVCDNWEKRP